MNRTVVTPKQLRLVYGTGILILFLLFAADLVRTRQALLIGIEHGLENAAYVLARLLSDEPQVTERNLIEILDNVNLDPHTQITVMDTTFKVIVEHPAGSGDNHIRLTESELKEMVSVHPAHPAKLMRHSDGSTWLVKINHIEDGRYYVMMAGSQTEGLSTFYQRLGIYLFLLILISGVAYLLLSIQLRLLRSETRFRSMIDDFTDIPIQGFSPDGTVVYWNKASAKEYGYTEEEMIGSSIHEIMHSEANKAELSRILHTLVTTKHATEPIRWTLTNKDGHPVEAVTYFTLLTDSSGNHEIFCIDVNVGALVDAQQRIQDLLNEKEMILKEVHHRIKNNMNTISGMLWLQADTLKDKAAAQALLDAQGRIMNMMILYNKLFRSAHFTSLSVKEFIEDMITHIRVTQDPSERIELHLDIEDAQIDSKKLQTVGMMVNELMTNVYKYAFPLGAEGHVWVSIRFPEPGLLHLEVKDSGKGLPESILNHTDDDGFGMMLIRMLCEQLGATYEIRNDNGASFSFRIPI